MKIFIQASDYKIWGIIVSGPHTPIKFINNVLISKAESEWDENDERMAQLNAKTMNFLYCALDANEFNRILGYISVKEIWVKLEVTYEGTNQVKETRINMLVHRYELFQMKQNESISSMFSHFTNIINRLKCLGKMYSNSDLVKKVLRSLPRTWEPKVTAIQEAKDLNTYTLDEMLSSLMTYELIM